uniref:SCP domain-containing protein n=1 Tax=Chaetoceros debilis TaxID=122233 RepID=A0A7S3QFV4_9STRA
MSSQSNHTMTNNSKEAASNEGVYFPMMTGAPSSSLSSSSHTTTQTHCSPKKNENATSSLLQEWLSSHDESYAANFGDAPDYDSYMKAQERSKFLPRDVGAFGSHHVMINKERVSRSIEPLIRNQLLDEIALKHAEYMASFDRVQHSRASTTMLDIKRFGNGIAKKIVGENVLSSDVDLKGPLGKSHATKKAYDRQFATSIADRKNILNSEFHTFGVGTSQSDSGIIYICQIFCG